MHESDKELMDRVLKEMEDVQVPESLQPSNIEAMLREQDEKKAKVIKMKRRNRIYRYGGLAAACVCLLAGLTLYPLSQYSKMRGSSDDAGDIAAAEEVELPEAEENTLAIDSDKASEDTTVKADAATEKLATAKDYDEIYKYFENYQEQYKVYYDTGEEESNSLLDNVMEALGAFGLGRKDYDVSYETEEATADYAGTGAAPKENAARESDYSETNTREENVDEGDVVKTDGRYLYILKENETVINVVDTKGETGAMEMIAEIAPEDIKKIDEMYLSSDKSKLVLVCEYWNEEEMQNVYRKGVDVEYAEEEVVDSVEDVAVPYGYNTNRGTTIAITYDLSDHKAPKEVGRVNQTGYYKDSRMVDDYLYLFSNYGVAIDFLKRDSLDSFIPRINETLLGCGDICIPESSVASRYLVVTSVDLSSPSEVMDSKAIMTDYGQLYVSDKNIYYYEEDYQNSGDTVTVIRNISYDKGQLKTGHKGKVPGYVDDSFAIDEYDGYLRVITTIYDYKTDKTTNEVNVLDQKLDIVGSIKDLAEGELVYSARLMGKTGYFVTFRQTDPLFSVDFSDPKNPKIIGKLKIPGFSEYLHPWGDGKLLGIGMDADEETGITNGLKISMFDISDPSDVKEEDVYYLDNYYYSEALYNYKSVLASYDKNVIGFACENGDGTDYVLLSYDEKSGFNLDMSEEVNGYGWYGTRGIYINDVIYVVRGNVVEAYSLEDHQKVDDIIL